MFNTLGEIVDTLANLFYDSMESVIRATMKKHFLIRLPVFSIMWLLWLILFPIYMVVYICTEFDIEIFLIYLFCLALLATLILYPHEIKSASKEQHEWIEENLKRWAYISFFGEIYLMNLTDVMAFKLRWT